VLRKKVLSVWGSFTCLRPYSDCGDLKNASLNSKNCFAE